MIRDLADRGRALRRPLGKRDLLPRSAVIDQTRQAIEDDYKRRLNAAIAKRVSAYLDAHEELVATPGWERLTEQQRDEIARPIAPGHEPNSTACRFSSCGRRPNLRRSRLATAVQRVYELLDGDRVATVSVGQLLRGRHRDRRAARCRLSTGIREECLAPHRRRQEGHRAVRRT